MNQNDLSKSPSPREVMDEWSESRPSVDLKEDWSTMMARKMAKYPSEKKARRMYYDLYEFRCR